MTRADSPAPGRTGNPGAAAAAELVARVRAELPAMAGLAAAGGAAGGGVADEPAVSPDPPCLRR